MKKFLLGFIAGFVTRHVTFPDSTSNEVTEAFTDALKRFNDRLEKDEKPVAGQTVTPDDVRIVPDEPSEETP